MKRGDSPGITNHHHGILGLFLGDVFRTLLLLLLGSPLGCALRAPPWLCPGAAQGGSGGDMQPKTLTHRRGSGEQPPAWNKVDTYRERNHLFFNDMTFCSVLDLLTKRLVI